MIKRCGHCITTVFFISWGPLYSSFCLCVLLYEAWKIFRLLNWIFSKENSFFFLVCELGKKWKIVCNRVKQCYKWDSYCMFASKIFMGYLPQQFGSEVECTDKKAPKCWTYVVNGRGWSYRKILESISEVRASVNHIVVMLVIEWYTSSEIKVSRCPCVCRVCGIFHILEVMEVEAFDLYRDKMGIWNRWGIVETWFTIHTRFLNLESWYFNYIIVVVVCYRLLNWRDRRVLQHIRIWIS